MGVSAFDALLMDGDSDLDEVRLHRVDDDLEAGGRARVHAGEGAEAPLMTTSNSQIADIVEGLIESVNERGIRVAGDWYGRQTKSLAAALSPLAGLPLTGP